MSTAAGHSYKAAGVDLDASRRVKQRIGSIAAQTYGPQVLSGVGGFGALYELSGFREPVLVSSTDPVGTKLKVATAMGRFDSIGADLVNACINDIVVCGARPLFFLDYIATSRLEPDVVEALVAGIAAACREAGCALIGGETSEMPGVFRDGSFDLSGFVVGAVEKADIIDGSNVRDGDVLLGIPSNGLHTNGYSLVRHAFGLDDDPSPLYEHRSELGQTLGEALLTPHPSYCDALKPAFPLLKAIAHITGGGLPENVPRVLPEGLAACFDRSTWKAPPIFATIQARAEIPDAEMLGVFNMGLGMVLVCDPSKVHEVIDEIPSALVVGRVTEAADDTRVIL